MTLAATADLYDAHEEALQSCDAPLRDYGGVAHFGGPIVTLRAREDNRVLKEIVAEPGEGRVIVVDAEGVTRCAMLGDNVALTAANNGWAGIIINGAVRDVLELREIGIGVKALGSNPRKSRKLGVGERDVPLSFGGASFLPGAHLVSDADGVVVAPAELGILS